jgi:hypothetical protein
MDATTAAASVAAISGLAAYVNAKHHIAQDLKALRFKKRAASYYEELGMYHPSRALLLPSHIVAYV